MTVTATNRKCTLTTNGVTTEFPFYFAITDTSQVYAYTVEDGVETEYTDFTVTKNTDSEGGTLTTNEALDGVELLIYRDVDITQEVDYENGGRFPADSHEQAIDKLTLQNQDQQEILDRTLKSDISNTTPYTVGDLVDGEVLFTDGTKVSSTGVTKEQLTTFATNSDSILAEAQQSADDATAKAEEANASAVIANGYVSTSELEVIARSLNVLDSQVIYSTDTTTVLDDVLYIYDADTQTTLAILDSITGEYIQSISGNVLTTDTSATYVLKDTANPNVKTKINITQLGNSSGNTDYTTEILSAWKSGVELTIPEGLSVAVVDSSLTLPSNFTLTGGGKLSLIRTPLVTDFTKYGDALTITEECSLGNRNVYLSDITNITIGDFLFLDNGKPKVNLDITGEFDYEVDTDPYDIQTLIQCVAEVIHVGNDYVTLKNPLKFNFPSDTSTVQLVTCTTNTTIDGVEISYIDYTYPAAHLQGLQGCTIKKNKFNVGALLEYCDDGVVQLNTVQQADTTVETLTSLDFFFSNRNDIVGNRITHDNGDASVLLYRGSCDNVVLLNKLSSTGLRWNSGIMAYDCCLDNVIMDNNIQGFHKSISLWGYSRGTSAINNKITIGHVTAGGRLFSYGIDMYCTSDNKVALNTVKRAGEKELGYNFYGVSLTGVSNSEIIDNKFISCTASLSAPVAFQGYTNAALKGVSAEIKRNRFTTGYVYPTSYFDQNTISTSTVGDIAASQNQNSLDGKSYYYAIKSFEAESGTVIEDNTFVGYGCGVYTQEVTDESFIRSIKKNKFIDCGIGVMMANSAFSPASSTVLESIKGNEFHNTYNAIVVYYYAGQVIDDNEFSGCHNLINFMGDSEAWRGHEVSSTSFGRNNEYRDYYNLMINAGTFSILNENVAKLPDGAVIRGGNDYVNPVSAEYTLADNTTTPTGAYITRVISES